MKTQDKLPGIDFGRLAAVSVFAFLMIINFAVIKGEMHTLLPVDAKKAITFTHNLLVAGFYVLVICLYFLRSSASSTTRSFSAKFIAVFASFVPFCMPLFGRSADQAGPIMLIISNAVMLAGTAFTLAALGTLRRSFSIIPQTRNLVVRGPYRLVRHPAYL